MVLTDDAERKWQVHFWHGLGESPAKKHAELRHEEERAVLQAVRAWRKAVKAEDWPECDGLLDKVSAATDALDGPLMAMHTVATLHLYPCQEGAPRNKQCGTPGSAVGVAVASAQDPFDPAEGRKLALARALQQLVLPESTKYALWIMYFKRVGMPRGMMVRVA